MVNILKVALTICLVSCFCFSAPVTGLCEDGFFSDLNLAATSTANGEVAPEVKVVAQLASHTVTGEGEVVSHNFFTRELDAPPFYNFHSTETNTITGYSRTNMGTCYGISMITLRYFQWFILPSLIDDEALLTLRGKKYGLWGKPKTKRNLPAYAKQVAKDFNLPHWMLSWPEGSQADRTKRIEPYRLRIYLSKNQVLAKKVEESLKHANVNAASKRLDPEIAKEHAVRMFDNQMGLMRKGAQLYEIVSRKTHEYGNSDSKTFRALFGRCAFDTIKKTIDDNKFGVAEIGMWGSKLKPIWGHSIIAYKIIAYDAVSNDGEAAKAFKIDLYDNNDPFNGSDNVFWYLSDVQKFTTSEKYAALYDSDSPLLPAGKDFMNPTQMGPSTESFTIKFEENLMNRFSNTFEKIEVKK